MLVSALNIEYTANIRVLIARIWVAVFRVFVWIVPDNVINLRDVSLNIIELRLELAKQKLNLQG